MRVRSRPIASYLALLALLSAGCHRTRPVELGELPPTLHVRLWSGAAFRFVPIDSTGRSGAAGCRARHITARLSESRRDTLVLRDVRVIWGDDDSAPCLRSASVVVVPSENRALRIGVIEGTPGRALFVGVLISSAAFVSFLFIVYAIGMSNS